MTANKMVFQDMEGNDQEISITVLSDRILATCNGSTAIFPLYNRNDPMNYAAWGNPSALAEEIYRVVYTGNNQHHRVNITTDIERWLIDGDDYTGRTAAELAADWSDYDQKTKGE